MKKTEAISKIMNQLEKLNSLPAYQYNDNNDEFKKWERFTSIIIENVFDTKHKKEFDNIRFTPMVYNLSNSESKDEESFSFWHNLGRKDAKQLLESFIEEIKEIWEDEILLQQNIKSKENILKGKKVNDIFISHISEEKEIALVFKRWIEDTFLGQYTVFVSNDDDCITIGDKWLEQISNAINESKILIAICSEKSMPRPWINFEIECAYSKKIHIMPLCHSGMTKGSLPSPISEFQGINLDSAEQLEKLFKGISKHLSVSKLPRISYKEMLDEINNAIGNQKIENYSEDKGSTLKDLEEDKLNILLNLVNIGDKEIELKPLAKIIGMHEAKLEYYLTEFDHSNLVSASYYTGSYPTTYSLGHKGKEYLIKNGHL